MSDTDFTQILDDSEKEFKSYKHTLKPVDGEIQTQFQDRTLNAISELQMREKDLMNKISKDAEGNELTVEQKYKNINAINEMAEARVALYTQLNQNAVYLKDRYGDTRNSAVNQRAVVNIVESELNNVKKQMNIYKTDLTNKLRLIEINDYYDKKYTSQADILKVISGMCLIIIVILMVNKKEYISQQITQILIGIVLGIGLIIIILKLWNVFIRDNQNFDEIDWFLKPKAQKDTDDNGGKKPLSNKYECPVPIGQTNSKQDNSSTVAESFTGMLLRPFQYESSLNHVKLV